MHWIDKHRPTCLDELDIHETLTERLEILSAEGEIPHLLFCGPRGGGKRTRIYSLLKKIYGPGIDLLRNETRTFLNSSNKSIDIDILASNYHIEISPSDAGIYDRIVVQDIIKEIAESKSLTATLVSEENRNSLYPENLTRFKVVFLNGVDLLSRQAQAGLRRTMEKYTSSCRLILTCHNLSMVIEPLRSRCLNVKVPLPTESEVCKVLKNVSKKEELHLPPELALKIAKKSKRNLSRALIMFEMCHIQKNPLSPDQQILSADWEIYIEMIAKDIASNQTPSALSSAREKIYELWLNSIPAPVILACLAKELVMLMTDDDMKHQIIYWASFYDTRMCQSDKVTFQIEAFIAKFMKLYKARMIDIFSNFDGDTM